MFAFGGGGTAVTWGGSVGEVMGRGGGEDESVRERGERVLIRAAIAWYGSWDGGRWGLIGLQSNKASVYVR